MKKLISLIQLISKIYERKQYYIYITYLHMPNKSLSGIKRENLGLGLTTK